MKSRLLIMLASLASVAAAQTPPADVARCTAIDSDAERLACYDQLFVRSANQPPKEAKAADQPQQEAKAAAPAAAAQASAASASANLDDFGLDGRKTAGQADPKPLEEIQARIAKLETQPRGEAVLTLDNGQVWQQQEYDWHLAFKVGDEVIIKRGALRSYRLQQKGNNRVTPVTRIR
jgi:hypothetical protein